MYLSKGFVMEFMEFGWGTSNDDNPLKSGAYAATEALKNIKNTKYINLAFLFSSPDYEPEEVLNGVKLILGNNIPIVGGSARYSIINNKLHSGVSVGIVSSKYLDVGIGVGLGVSINPEECGKRAVETAIKDLGMAPKLVMVFMSHCNFEEEVLNGIIKKVGMSIPVFGGVTSDNFEFNRTYQYCNDVYVDSVVCVAFGGDIVPKITIGRFTERELNSKGIKGRVTEANKRYVTKINNINALEYYASVFNYKKLESLSKDREFYFAHQFGILDLNGRIYLKGPVSIKNNTLVFGSNIREGIELVDYEIEKNKVGNIFEEINRNILNTPPHYSHTFSFLTLPAYLAEIGKESVNEWLTNLGDLYPLFGFSSYGEILFGEYNNYTISLCSILPDLSNICIKEGIFMLTKYPASKETIKKIYEMGCCVKIEKLAESLGIHRRTAYDRVEPLLRYGFAKKEGSKVELTELGRLLLKKFILKFQ